MSISEIADCLGLQRHVVSKELTYLQQIGQVEMTTIGSSKVFSHTERKPIFGILDYTSDAILVLNEEGEIVEINVPLLLLVNLSRDDLQGRRIGDCPGPLFSTLRQDSCDTEGLEEVTVGFPVPDDPKAIRHFRVKYIPTVFEDAARGTSIFIEEITEQIRYRDALLLSEEQYKRWTLVTEHASWAPRAGAVMVVKNGYMYLLGGEDGFTCLPGGRCPPYFNDVWRSRDGANWEPVTQWADWAPRPGHQAAVLHGTMVLFGGFRAEFRPGESVRAGESHGHLGQQGRRIVGTGE